MKRRKFLFTGPSEAGKSSLCSALFGMGKTVHKTQGPEFYGFDAVDIPGEYITHPRWRTAFLASAEDVDTIIVVLPANIAEPCFHGDLLRVMPWTRIAGIISKIDLPDADLDKSRRIMASLGVAEPVFETSVYWPETLDVVKRWIGF